jgi:hypothetical protein
VKQRNGKRRRTQKRNSRKQKEETISGHRSKLFSAKFGYSASLKRLKREKKGFLFYFKVMCLFDCVNVCEGGKNRGV